MLLGRQRQTLEIDQLLRAARMSEGGALVIRGETGVGKTALLSHAAATAAEQGIRVLSVAGFESESDLAFSSLATVLRPILDHLYTLPDRQRQALEAALMLGPSVEGERFAVYLAALDLLAAAAERTPLAVLVDDAQWLDGASLETLLFAARRLRGTPIVHIFTVRTGPSFPSTEGLRDMILVGLDADAAGTLLSRTAKGPVAPVVAVELHRETAGNPLALIELGRALDASELDGRRPLPEPLPIAVHLELGFGARIGDLSPGAQRALVVAAACGECDIDSINRALTTLGLPADALAAGQAAGLIEIRDGAVVFRHPLIRSAAYRRADDDDRRAAHCAIAGVLDGPKEREQRAWHLGACAAGPDAAIADELATMSQLALGRGSHPAAAAALEKAARLTPDPSTRMQRLVAAAGLWELAGSGTRALALADEAHGRDDALLEAARHHVRGRVLMWAGDPARARDVLVDAAGRIETAAPAQAALMLVDASVSATMTGDCAGALEIARRAHRLGGLAGGFAALASDYALAHALVLGGFTHEGLELGRRVVARAGELPSHAATSILASLPIILHFGEDHEAARTLLMRSIDVAREEGVLAVLPYALSSLALIESRLGRTRRALASATEAMQLARDLGVRSELAFAQYCAAIVEGGLGMEAESRRDAREALHTAQDLGIQSLVTMTSAWLGALELSLQRPEAALGPLETARSLLRHQHMRQPIVAPWNAEYIEALIQLRRRPEAEIALQEFTEIVENADSRWGRAVVARCRALLAPDASAAAAFEEAIALHDADRVPLDRARTRLRFGQLLHHQRRTIEARRQLRAALSEFELIEARPWIDQAKAALAATGERAGEAATAHLALLTPQETQVCLEVAAGATNREVAAKLFLSTKTVETHLTSAYRKLAVRSRTELAGLLARHEPASGLLARSVS